MRLLEQLKGAVVAAKINTSKIGSQNFGPQKTMSNL